MNGGAIYQAMGAIFVAKAYGISLDLSSYVTLILTTIFSAIGTAGIPGGGFIMLSAVLSSVGLPLEGLALLAGIDRLRDMMTTVLNILGDAAVTVFIAKQEGESDESAMTAKNSSNSKVEKPNNYSLGGIGGGVPSRGLLQQPS